ncbi:hypothetical protein Tco_0601773 [Tanacetum coccineum]
MNEGIKIYELLHLDQDLNARIQTMVFSGGDLPYRGRLLGSNGRPQHYYERVYQAVGRKKILRRESKDVNNRETVTYLRSAIMKRNNEDVHDLGSVETEFLAIVFNDTLTSEATFSCEPMVSSLNNDEID